MLYNSYLFKGDLMNNQFEVKYYIYENKFTFNEVYIDYKSVL